MSMLVNVMDTINGYIYNLIIIFAIVILIVGFAKYGIQLFITEPKAAHFGMDYLKTISLFYPFLGINFVLDGAVRVAGAMFQVLVLNIISFWILRYPITFVLSGIIGEKGIALGMGFNFVISSIAAFIYYRYGKWQKVTVFGQI